MSQTTLFDIDPLPASQRHSLTSRAAARGIAPSASTLRDQVYGYLRACGLDGATDEQIQRATGLSGDTERPRRIELLKAGRIMDSGRVRATASGQTAVVWVTV